MNFSSSKNNLGKKYFEPQFTTISHRTGESELSCYYKKLNVQFA